MNSSDDELTVYTISDERYLPGVVGLVNSLRHHGFQGPICIGAMDNKTKDVSGENLRTVDLEPRAESHPVNYYKLQILDSQSFDRFLFLDADILVTDDNFVPKVKQWIGLAPVFAAEALIAETDHRRHTWRKITGKKMRDPSPIYYNSGMFGGDWSRDHNLFKQWMELNRTELGSADHYFSGTSYPMSDQEMLNAILQQRDRDELISIAPPDWWSAAAPNNPFLHVGGFPDGPAFLHCTTSRKPWLLEETPRRGPNVYERRWLDYVEGASQWISYEVSIPSSLRRWLNGHWTVRMSNKLRRLGKRLLP